MIRTGRALGMLLMFVGCKAADAGANRACTDACERDKKAVFALQADMHTAESAADDLETIDIKDDAAMKAAGDRALTACITIRTSAAHARGITLMKTAGDEHALEQLDRVACVGRSPAQIKSDVVAPVRAFAKSKPVVDDQCESRCPKP